MSSLRWKAIGRLLFVNKSLAYILFKNSPLLEGAIVEQKPTNVGRIALERKARPFNSGAVA